MMGNMSAINTGLAEDQRRDGGRRHRGQRRNPVPLAISTRTTATMCKAMKKEKGWRNDRQELLLELACDLAHGVPIEMGGSTGQIIAELTNHPRSLVPAAHRPVAAQERCSSLRLTRCAQANCRAMNLPLRDTPCSWRSSARCYAVRRVIRRRALRRQKKPRRARPGKPSPRAVLQPLGSKRSQMRTDDDPTTVMERITETKPPADGTRKKVAIDRRHVMSGLILGSRYLANAYNHPRARVVKLVNTRDLKSLGRKALPVRVRPRAPGCSSLKPCVCDRQFDQAVRPGCTAASTPNPSADWRILIGPP